MPLNLTLQLLVSIIVCFLYLLFYLQSQNKKLKLWELWGCRADGSQAWRPFLHFPQSTSCKNFWDHREKENLVLLMENENPRGIYESWKGNGFSWYGEEVHEAGTQNSEPAFHHVTHRGGTETCQRDCIGYRCPRMSKFILFNCHGNTSCLWNHAGEWGGLHVQMYIYSDFYKPHYFQRRARWKQPTYKTRLCN